MLSVSDVVNNAALVHQMQHVSAKLPVMLTHQLHDRTGKAHTTKCGATVSLNATTVWYSKTNCPKCLNGLPLSPLAPHPGDTPDSEPAVTSPVPPKTAAVSVEPTALFS